ncbi:MAG: hypothetical protein R3264_11930, partial [Anaerolineae bacterium]|nr:hypothetical protein [Anaerolineae bacterium]
TISSNTKSVILFAWPLGVLLIVFSIILMYEDYLTSRAGYLALPTLKVNNGWVTFAVAALPQVGQIVLFYIFGRDTRRGWAALMAFIFFAADLGTDSWFKSGGQLSLIPLAVVESLFIFTLGSEVLFTIAVGFVTETFHEFMLAGSNFIKGALDAVTHSLENLGLNTDVEDHRR